MEETGIETKNAVSARTAPTMSGRILLAEDNKAIREIVSTILDFMGFEVVQACNGAEALSLFLEKSFDMVLTDFEMPIMDGLGLTRCIKERSPNTPVVLMTGSDRETVRKEAKRGCVDSVIFKPFRREDLQRTVQGALAVRAGEQGSLVEQHPEHPRPFDWTNLGSWRA